MVDPWCFLVLQTLNLIWLWDSRSGDERRWEFRWTAVQEETRVESLNWKIRMCDACQEMNITDMFCFFCKKLPNEFLPKQTSRSKDLLLSSHNHTLIRASGLRSKALPSADPEKREDAADALCILAFDLEIWRTLGARNIGKLERHGKLTHVELWHNVAMESVCRNIYCIVHEWLKIWHFCRYFKASCLML